MKFSRDMPKSVDAAFGKIMDCRSVRPISGTRRIDLAEACGLWSVVIAFRDEKRGSGPIYFRAMGNSGCDPAEAMLFTEALNGVSYLKVVSPAEFNGFWTTTPAEVRGLQLTYEDSLRQHYDAQGWPWGLVVVS